MTVKMTRIKNVVIALLLIEFIFALMGYVFLSSNTSLVLATYIFIKNVIVLGFIFYSSSLANENNLSVSEALNNEAKNAFIFGGIGLIKYDENRGTTEVATLSAEKLKEIAEYKIPDLNAIDLESAMKIIAGTARNMGVKVEA